MALFLSRSALSRSASMASCAALLSMAAAPAQAAPAQAAGLPHAGQGGLASAQMPAPSGWSVEQETAHRHRWGGYRGYRGYRGYGGWGRHHHHGGVDAGDVLAGVLIIGGIAAIASAASRDSQRRRVETDPNGYPYRNDRNRDWEYRYRENSGSDYRSGSADRGLDNAADICAREVERTERVDEVNGVDRTASGWRVEGRLANGRGFTCEIDNDGRLGPVNVDGARVSGADAGQWNDEAYARARAEQDDNPSA